MDPLVLILIIVVILAVLGGGLGYRSGGLGPGVGISGIVGLLVVVVIIILLLRVV